MITICRWLMTMITLIVFMIGWLIAEARYISRIERIYILNINQLPTYCKVLKDNSSESIYAMTNKSPQSWEMIVLPAYRQNQVCNHLKDITYLVQKRER